MLLQQNWTLQLRTTEVPTTTEAVKRGPSLWVPGNPLTHQGPPTTMEAEKEPPPHCTLWPPSKSWRGNPRRRFRHSQILSDVADFVNFVIHTQIASTPLRKASLSQTALNQVTFKENGLLGTTDTNNYICKSSLSLRLSVSVDSGLLSRLAWQWYWTN